MKKDTNFEKLRHILEQTLSHGAPMTILTNPDKPSYTPEEASKIALDGYLMGLVDVLDFIDGKPSGLKELQTPDGKLVAIDTDQPLFVVPVGKEEIESGESESEPPR